MNGLAFTPAAFLLLVSCTGLPLFGQTEAGRAETESTSGPEWASGETATPPRARVELQNIRYDGRRLSGRILISAVDHDLALDRRLIEEVSLTTESVSDCTGTQPVRFIVMDVYSRRPGKEDILVLSPGYWYGKDISVLLFDEEPDGGANSACIEVEFAFHALGGKTAATLRVRAERAPQPVPDAGTPFDAGTPVDSQRGG